MNDINLYTCSKCKKAIESDKNRLICDACKKQFGEIIGTIGAVCLSLVAWGLRNPDDSDQE
ncbi:hypothetical protein HO912_09120 [Streptococcus suis]|nr:hypothetical protein [Streptococcus suis]